MKRKPKQKELSRPRATRSSDRRGQGRSPIKAEKSAALHSSARSGGMVEGAPSASVQQEVVTCVGFKVVLFRKEMTEDERRAADRLSSRLHTLRNWMHWLMNSAADAWRYADKRASSKNPDKEVRDRGEVTAAVKDACERQRAYALSEVEKASQGVEKLRAKLGTARARNRAAEVARLEEALANELRKLDRARDASELVLPGSMRDVIVVRAQDAFKRWAKNKGAMAYPSFRHGQPIHYRDGDWDFEASDRRGIYLLTVPVGVVGRAIERATLTIVPDSGSAHAFAKMMVDGRAKRCNASLTWSEKKRCWFAKLTIKYEREAPERVTEGGSCALRLGVHNAIVLAFDDGDVEVIRGRDLVRYKERVRARYTEIQQHLRSRECGSGGRGHGRKRRFRALERLAEREENHVDTTMGRWANQVLNAMRARGTSTLYVALDPSSMTDAFAGDDDTRARVQAYLARFPRAKLRDAIERVIVADGRTFRAVNTRLDAKTCPACRHRHEQRPKGDTFHCEVCGASAPADTVAGWNLINEMVGSNVPFRERLKKRAATLAGLKNTTNQEASDGGSSDRP